jgi:hypothetical protein
MRNEKAIFGYSPTSVRAGSILFLFIRIHLPCSGGIMPVIVEHIPTGLFFKKYTFSDGVWKPILVSRQKARVFASRAGVKNSLGTIVFLNPPKKYKNKYGYITKFSVRILDETVWKIHEVQL